MKLNKIKLLLPLILVLFSLTSCGEVININVENSEKLNNTVLGTEALVKISDNLYYDQTTRIVYWWNGCLIFGSAPSTTPSLYYAPNGLPYRYNPKINTFEEIEKE